MLAETGLNNGWMGQSPKSERKTSKTSSNLCHLNPLLRRATAALFRRTVPHHAPILLGSTAPIAQLRYQF